MHALKTLQKALQNSYAKTHCRRVEAVWRGVEGLLSGGRLWLTCLGRHLPGKTCDKHKIKAADRLLGNRWLQAELPLFYRGLAKWLLRGLRNPVLLVDATGAGPHQTEVTAALSFTGRALPLFSRVYRNKDKPLSPKNQRQFIRSLANVLPTDSVPILVTDAGYHSAWFEAVLKQGWHFVGRIRNRTHAKVDGEWVVAKSLHARARKYAQNLGKLCLYKSHPMKFRFVLSNAPKKKGRQRRTTRGTKGRRTTDHQAASRAKEPWLLATSLKCNAKTVVAIYATRMQIEESFRDRKSFRHGWSLRHLGCHSPERTAVLLLCAALANVALQLIGIAAERRNLHHAFQANTVRNRRVFSYFVLARLILARGQEPPASDYPSIVLNMREQLGANCPLSLGP